MTDRPASFFAPAMALAFALLASLGAGLFATQMPPFANPDEPNHLLRIDQLRRGGLIGERQGPHSSGGAVDRGLLEAIGRWMPIHLARDPGFRFTAPVLAEIGGPRWQGRAAPAGFPNTAVYPPPLYMPAVLGLSLGRATRMTLGQSMLAARLASAAATVLVGAAAIVLAGAAAPWFFALLTLPMATAQIAAAAPDGPMLACAALAAAIIAAALRGEQPATPRRFALAAGALALVILARPAYAPLALALMAVPGLALGRRLAGLVGALLPALAWWAYASAVAMVELDPGVRVDSGAQLAGLLQQPWRIPEIALNTWTTFGQMYLDQFIGVLGWYEVTLPGWYRNLAWGVLALAALGLALAPRAMEAERRPGGAALRHGFCLLALLATLGLVFLSLYLTWSEVGLGYVDGVQGRYLYPIAAFLPCLVPALAPAGLRGLGPVRLAGMALLLGFAALSLVVALQRILQRYYLG